jgi:type VI secretion system protein ImpG
VNPRLLELYNQELGHVREMGAEFARQFPKIAGRLSLDDVEVADPYVERLLEGFAFLAARVQLKIEAEFPRFVQHLMEVTYPALLAPVPALGIARLDPDPAEPKLAQGVRVPRASMLRSVHARGADTRCQFRTAHEVTLWPLQIASVQYFSFAPDLPLARIADAARARGGLRIRLCAFDGIELDDIALDRLAFYIAAADDPAFRLYELIFGHLLGVLAVPGERPAPWSEWWGPQAVRAVGFDEDEALLPPARAGFRGYRLLQEYAALPQRFLFFEVQDLARAVRRGGTEFELVLLFDRGDAALESLIDAASLALHCTPIVNLFPKRLDRVQVGAGQWEFHVVADRTRPLDYEIYRLEQVTGYGGAGFGELRFQPLYTSHHLEAPETRAYFTVRREPRLIAPAARNEGPRSSYRGSEVFVALVDPHEAPFRDDLRQLAIEALVTNRDLPLLLPAGGLEPADRNDFLLETSAPVARVSNLRGLTRPRAASESGAVAWDLVSQLSLNYLSLVDANEREGAALLRSMLLLYAPEDDAALRRQIEGVSTVAARQVVRRLPFSGPLTFGTGVEITVTCDELAFQGGSAFLLGAVLDRFFARYAAVNTFTEAVLRSTTRGEIKRWAPRAGTRPLL